MPRGNPCSMPRVTIAATKSPACTSCGGGRTSARPTARTGPANGNMSIPRRRQLYHPAETVVRLHRVPREGGPRTGLRLPRKTPGREGPVRRRVVSTSEIPLFRIKPDGRYPESTRSSTSKAPLPGPGHPGFGDPAHREPEPHVTPCCWGSPCGRSAGLLLRVLRRQALHRRSLQVRGAPVVLAVPGAAAERAGTMSER